MKIVSYGRGNAYFLTDKQFDAAVREWASGNSALFPSIGALLPRPKMPAGIPSEHRGLQIGFSWNNTDVEIPGLPGWIAIQKPTKKGDIELRRGAVYRRGQDRNSEQPARYCWEEINVRDPIKSNMDLDVGSEEIKAFIDAVGYIDADDILEDDDMRNSVPWEQLLPDYLLPW